MAGLSSSRSNCSSRSSFIYPNVNSGSQSPNRLSFEADHPQASASTYSLGGTDEDTERDGDDSSSSEDNTQVSSGDERYLETRLSDMEFQSTFRSGMSGSRRSNSHDTHRQQLVPIMTHAQIRQAILGNGTATAEERGGNTEEEHTASPRNSVSSQDPNQPSGTEVVADDELTEDQIRLRREFEKMRRLDKILRKKQRLADRVKRDRISFQRHVVSEVELIESGNVLSSDRTPSREETVNTSKYMALVKNDIQLKPTRFKMLKQDGSEAEGFEPVFATQPDLDDDKVPGFSGSENKRGKKSQASSKSTKSPKGAQSPSMRSDSQRSGSSIGEASSTASTKNSATSKGSSKNSKHNKKFIERNKELASDAANVIPMTNEERSRLDGLLKDIDTIDEELHDLDEMSPLSPIPGSVGQLAPRGSVRRYSAMSETDSKLLNEIDDKLSGYLTFEQFKEICWNSGVSGTAHSASITGSAIDDASETNEGSNLTTGDEKIRETREDRIAQIRVAHIDEKLRRMQLEKLQGPDAIDYHSENSQSVVSQSQLRRLLNELTQQHSSELEQGLIYPKPNEDQIKSLLSVSRPSTALEEWTYIGCSTSRTLAVEVEEITKYLDKIDAFVEAIEYSPEDDPLSGLNIESIEGSNATEATRYHRDDESISVQLAGRDKSGSRSAEKLSQDLQMLDLRTDMLMRRLANLPELKEPPDTQWSVTAGPGSDLVGRSVTFEEIEQNERLYELDRDMEHLRSKLEALEKLREQTLSHVSPSQETSTEN